MVAIARADDEEGDRVARLLALDSVVWDRIKEAVLAEL